MYFVEDISENYIESPFRDPGTFVALIKQAMDIVQCRLKPEYMEPNSPVWTSASQLALHVDETCAGKD